MKTVLTLGAAVTVLLGTATPVSAAANPKTSYTVRHGKSYVTGSLIWYNRSIQVGGTLRADRGCRTAVYTVWAGRRQIDRETRSACGRTARHGFKLSANVRGGASQVVVDIFQGVVRQDRKYCERWGCFIYGVR
ncbi:hypothetical protein ABZ897_26695 [Nonomuraea sp. NPDC046802]|uniref:hypothetical protein n=1 Tax=Nonomuraea sp. NPDC046802 TaxID=3154919 RepID=UPI0034085532